MPIDYDYENEHRQWLSTIGKTQCGSAEMVEVAKLPHRCGVVGEIRHQKSCRE